MSFKFLRFDQHHGNQSVADESDDENADQNEHEDYGFRVEFVVETRVLEIVLSDVCTLLFDHC